MVQGVLVLGKGDICQGCSLTLLFSTQAKSPSLDNVITSSVDNKVRVVIIQVGKDIMFSTDLRKVAEYFGGKWALRSDLFLFFLPPR